MSTGTPNNSYTRDLVQKDKDHFVHPWQIFDVFKHDGALAIDRGEGCRVWDTDGQRGSDCPSSQCIKVP